MLIDDFNALEEANDLSMRKRGEMKSALKTVGRAVGDESLRKIPSKISSLNRLLKDVSPAALGIGERRWQNVLSLARAALARSQVVEPGRRKPPPSSDWAPLYAQLGKSGRVRLSKIVRYLSEEQITPETVTVEHIASFTARLEATVLEGNVHTAIRDAASAWRVASRSISGWPQIAWTVPSRRQDWTMPWDAFPQSFQKDVEAYLEHLSHDDPLGDGGYRRAGPKTIKRRRFDIKALASASVLAGRPAASITLLADLLELDALKKAVKYLLRRRTKESANRQNESSYIADIVRCFLNIARHWVRDCPPAVVEEIKRINHRLTPKHSGLTKKNDERLRQFDTAANRQALLNLPRVLMKEADSGRLRPHRAALLAQLAVAIEIELLCPVRLGNLVGLTLDQIRYRRGKLGTHLHISGEEVKNRHPIDLQIPESARALLERYLKVYWPRLAKPSCKYLFPGRGGIGHKIDNALSSQIQKIIKRRVGVDMNVHLFRHFCALLLLRRFTGQFALVALVLGHTSERTARRYYARFEQEQAFKEYDSVIDEERAGFKEAA